MFVPRSRYVPSRGATYAEETSDTKEGIRINTTAYIMAKLAINVYRLCNESRKPKTLENERMTGKKDFGGDQGEAVLK